MMKNCAEVNGVTDTRPLEETVIACGSCSYENRNEECPECDGEGFVEIPESEAM